MSLFKKCLNGACQITSYVTIDVVLIGFFLKYAALKESWTRETWQGDSRSCVIGSEVSQATCCCLGWVRIGDLSMSILRNSEGEKVVLESCFTLELCLNSIGE